jgi:hypothetical protein
VEILPDDFAVELYYAATSFIRSIRERIIFANRM